MYEKMFRFKCGVRIGSGYKNVFVRNTVFSGIIRVLNNARFGFFIETISLMGKFEKSVSKENLVNNKITEKYNC